MEDEQIVELYWSRSEAAIKETSEKYGKYCYSIAYNILYDSEDAAECVNDTYLDAWNCIPPHRPSVLSTFLGRITRRIAIDRWRSRTAGKRGGNETDMVIDELSDCIASDETVEQEYDSAELGRLIDTFVMGLAPAERRIFIRRYWYLDAISDISRRYDYSQSKVKVILHRTRNKLREYLQRKGMI